MIARYATAFGVGAGVTFGLLFIMQLLIATGQQALTEGENFRLGDFVRVERNEVIETKKEKPEKPPEPEVMPEMPAPDMVNDFDTSMAVSISTPQLSARMNMGGFGFGISDGEYLPIVKVAPIYPARALQRGLNGYVIVEFTVTAAGTTRDATVVESTSSLFERNAMAAALKFKYKPRVIDGQAVEVPGVRNKISFEITE
jgi:protein TonB